MLEIVLIVSKADLFHEVDLTLLIFQHIYCSMFNHF